MDKKFTRGSWKSQVGFLLAAIGSSIGLGNIWRFPYVTYKYGGGAFLIPYFVALIVAGIPLLILEYGLGHRELGASPLSFARISSKWEWVGWWMPITALFGIMLYYSVVIGYCLIYLFLSFNLNWGNDTESFFFNSVLNITKSPFILGGLNLPIVSATLLVWAACWVISYKEIHHGIEKACGYFIPMLFVLLFVLLGWSVTLPGAGEGIKAYLHPQWDTLRDVKVWIAAFGQIFFSISLGFGIMITYASYLPRKANITRNAVINACANSFFEVIAGFAVFGLIGFMALKKGLPINSVIKQGPQLAFVVYPEAINNLPFFRSLFGVFFFSTLVIAGLTSAISLVEAFTCSLRDKFGWNRKKVVSYLCLIGFFGSLIFTTGAGLLILDITDHFVTNYGLIIGGIFECIIVGWILKSDRLRAHINASVETKSFRLGKWWDVSIRYITPAFLIIMLIISLSDELEKPYGDYPVDSVVLYGIDWLIIVGIISVVFTFYPWKPEFIERKHKPADEHILT